MAQEYTYRYSGCGRMVGIEPINDVIDYYDLTVVFSGQLDYVINETEYTVLKGDAILMPPGSKRVRLRTPHTAEFASMNFFSDEKISLPVHIPSCTTPALKDAVMLHMKLKEQRSSKYIDEKLSCSIKLIMLMLTENAEKKVYSAHVKGILNYISRHYTEKITLEDIAGSVFLTAPYCCSLVKKELGVTIYDIILRERVLLAQEYILAGEKKLREIPYLCGFNDYSHFSKYFKKLTGVLPSQYKK